MALCIAMTNNLKGAGVLPYEALQDLVPPFQALRRSIVTQ